jgi:molecular chaperone GrpE
MSKPDPKQPSPIPSDVDDDEIEILEIVGIEDEPAGVVEEQPEEDSGDLILDFDDELDEAEDGDVKAERSRRVRLQADFENFQKRVERERESDQRQAAARVLGNLLPVLDNFERAIGSATPEESNSSFHRGVQLIFRQILDELRREGLEAVPTMGQPFDPQVHEAIALEEHTDLPHHTIMEELLRGYTLHGRLLRPASVKVSTQPGMDKDD